MSPALQAAWDNCRRRLAARGVRLAIDAAALRPEVMRPEPSHNPTLPHHPPVFSRKDAAAGEKPTD